jgi:hypothetical protein
MDKSDQSLQAKDNAGLGLARDAAVIKELRKLSELKTCTILLNLEVH